MRMTTQPGKPTHGHGVRETCGGCGGAVAVYAPVDPGTHTTHRLCPGCHKRPELGGLISRLPTQAFLDHAATCRTCQPPDTLCPAGLAAMRQHPGHWHAADAAMPPKTKTK